MVDDSTAITDDSYKYSYRDSLDKLDSVAFDLKHYVVGLQCLLVGGNNTGDVVLDITQQELCALFEYVNKSTQQLNDELHNLGEQLHRLQVHCSKHNA